MSLPNRKTPAAALTHSRLADYTNSANVRPRFRIPKTPADPDKIKQFERAIEYGGKPYVSYDPNTKTFMCHGFPNDFTNDDCVHLVLTLQLVPTARPDNKAIGRLIMYIPVSELYKYKTCHVNSALVPDSLKAKFKAHEYDELTIKNKWGYNYKLKTK